MASFFVTYGSGSNLAGCFSVIESQTYGTARAVASRVTRNKFAFMYTEKDFAGQVEQYNLTEVPLQAQSFATCEDKDS